MRNLQLGELISTQKGYAFKSKWYCDEGHPIVKVSDFTEDSISTNALVKIPNEVAAEYRKYTLNAGDVVIQTVGSWPSNPASVVGKTIRVPNTASKALLNQNAVKVIPNESLNQAFLFYLLRSSSFKDYIISTAQGAASQASITLDSIKNYSFFCPEIDVQSEIALVLEHYDNLIENNNRRIAILEEMAQSLYREWFVKFRFPGHDQCQMVESPLGLIPEGWEIYSASDAIQINPKTKLEKKGEKPFLGMSGLSEASMIITGVILKEGNSGAKYINGDTLFSRITPCLQNGKIGYVQFLNPELPIGFGSTEFIVLRETELCHREFVYLLSRSDSFRSNAINSMSGATGRQRVHNACFDTFKLAVPPKEMMSKFTNVVRPMFENCYNLSRRNENLKKQRDLLLPKLISGQIDLSLAEQVSA